MSGSHPKAKAKKQIKRKSRRSGKGVGLGWEEGPRNSVGGQRGGLP